MRLGPTVNLSFTMQQIVHHSEQMAAPARGRHEPPAFLGKGILRERNLESGRKFALRFHGGK